MGGGDGRRRGLTKRIVADYGNDGAEDGFGGGVCDAERGVGWL